jgi:hypothetical protein
MSPSDVHSVLGEPSEIYEYPERRGLTSFLLGQRPTQWMYGTTLNMDYLIVPDLPCPNPLPLNMRILSYASEDLVIYWTPERTVAHVRRPKFDVPETTDAMAEAVEFVDVVFRNIVLSPK